MKSSQVNIIVELNELFDSIDLNVSIRRAMKLLGQKTFHKDIIWLPLEAVFSTNTYFHKVIWNIKASEKMGRDLILQLTQAISSIEQSADRSDPTHHHPTLVIDLANGQDLAIPVVNHALHQVAGYFVFRDLPKAKMKKIEKICSDYSPGISRHICFCLEHSEVKNLTFVDDVTSLYNQRYLQLVLDREVAKSKRSSSPFSLLFLDVDYFKIVNDTRGHIVGSKILVEISNLIREQIRMSDFAFRYGGDEFVVLLLDTPVGIAENIAERIRKKVEDTSFRIGGDDIRLTVSIGVAGFPDHAKTSEQIIQLADIAMYYAKNKSRNVVYVTAS